MKIESERNSLLDFCQWIAFLFVLFLLDFVGICHSLIIILLRLGVR